MGLFWVPFGASWRLLGASWGLLGRLGAVLEAVDGPKGREPKFPGALESVLEPSWVPKMEPKRSPRRPKIDHEIVLKNDRVSDRS